MKYLLIFGLFCLNNDVLGGEISNFNQFRAISELSANKIADAIFKVEGGNKTKYPYGIKSIKTNNPRKICLNTIKNNYIRWQKAGCKENYLNFLADKYCPPSVDKQGNINWKKNIHILVKIDLTIK